MSFLASGLLVLLTVFASGVFSGAETGFYSLSPVRVAAGRGRTWMARLARYLLRDEVGLLVVLLVANNLVNQAATYAGRGLVAPLGVPAGAREVVLTLLLTPLLFLFGELFPKDLFRRRPHALVVYVAPAIFLARCLLYPLVLVAGACSSRVGRRVGIGARELARVQGREEAVLDLLREGGARADAALGMARNVLGLRGLRIDRAMIPWRRVVTVRLDDSDGATRAAVGGAGFSRLPALDEAGRVGGYVHQVEVLRAGPGVGLGALRRPIVFLEPALAIDRALTRMKAGGVRMAVVGTAERPLGIVTLKDLVEEISGELARW